MKFSKLNIKLDYAGFQLIITLALIIVCCMTIILSILIYKSIYDLNFTERWLIYGPDKSFIWNRLNYDIEFENFPNMSQGFKSLTIFTVFLPLLLPSIVAILIFLKLFTIISNFRNHKFFLPENIRNIRFIGFTIIWGSIITTATKWLTIFLLSNQIDELMKQKILTDPQFSVWPGFDFSTLILGILVLLLVKIFQEGYNLQEDQKLTV